MKALYPLIVLQLLISSLYSQINFPQKDTLNGYSYSEIHARVAFPIDNKNRVWIKGSEENYRYKISNLLTSDVVEEANLLAPFYTNTIVCDADSVLIEFFNEEKIIDKTIKIHFNKNNDKRFSMLLYGCFEPFEITKENKKLVTGVYSGDKNSSSRIRQLFRDLAFEKEFNLIDFNRQEGLYNESKESRRGPVLENPSLIIGTGDQVYVDGSYGQKVKKGKHPLSAWELKKEPMPLLSEKIEYTHFLNQLYNASYSFADLEDVHKRIPSVHVIDDHELRDGWGSQGDEYLQGELNPKLKLHYDLAKEAYIQHQLVASNFKKETIDSLTLENRTMEFSFKTNGINGYVFDLRSARNNVSEKVLGEKQWKNFENWMENLEPDQEVVLVLSIPLSMRPMKGIEKLTYLLMPKLKDDLRDSWSSHPNRKDRDRLIGLLTYYRINKGIKPIIASGNIHKASITEIWVNPKGEKLNKEFSGKQFILAYEIISSGISHVGIEKASQKNSIADITESQKIGKIDNPYTFKDENYSYFPIFRIAVAEQNFGAIEFKGDTTEISTFYYNRFNEKLEQYYLQLDWDISFEESDKQRIAAKKSKNSYAPIPEGRWIVD